MFSGILVGKQNIFCDATENRKLKGIQEQIDVFCLYNGKFKVIFGCANLVCCYKIPGSEINGDWKDIYIRF